MRSFRLTQMKQYILDQKTVTLEQLSQKFNISMNTVRRDIKELIGTGNIQKVYGGVSAAENSHLIPYQERSGKQAVEKNEIARLAAEMIQPNEVIFIDSGTTTRHILEHLDPQKKITVVTYSLSVIMSALPLSMVDVIVLPGELQRNTNSFCGMNTIKALDNYNIDRAFMAATGISPEGGVTNSSLLEYEIKKKAMEKSRAKILMANSGKFGHTFFLTYARIREFQAVITGAPAPPELLALCNQAQTDLLCANLSERK